jgi:RNA polymerase sigma factor, sigma-70 family
MEVNYDELYYLIMEKNETAETILYNEVEKYLHWLCYNKVNDFLRKEDILSYGWQGYVEAFAAYLPDNSVTFKSFLQHCIGRRLIDVQRRHNKKSFKGHMTGMLMSEEKVRYSVEKKRATEVSDLKLTMRQFWKTLSVNEKRTFRLYIQGTPKQEIADTLGVSTTTVYKIIRKLRQRLKKELSI